jgi:hypothetical protein
MPQKTNFEDDCDASHEVEDQTWKGDQDRRGYYYDDAHGYQKYEPETDEEIIPDKDPQTENGPE